MKQQTLVLLHRSANAAELPHLARMSDVARSHGLQTICVASHISVAEATVFDHWHLVPSVDHHVAMFDAIAQLTSTHNVVQIVALDDALALAAAYFREEHDLPGLRPCEAIYFRDRCRMRERTARLNIPGLHLPQTVPPDRFAPIAQFMRTHRHIIIKPRRRDKSLPSFVIESEATLRRAWKEIRHHRHRYTIDQLIHGQRFGIETLVQHERRTVEMLFAYQADTINFQFPFHHIRPISRPQGRTHTALLQMNHELLRGFFLYGATHAEYVVTPEQQIFLIQFAGRFGDGPTLSAIEAAMGVHLPSEWIHGEIDPTYRSRSLTAHDITVAAVPSHAARLLHNRGGEDQESGNEDSQHLGFSLLVGIDGPLRTLPPLRYRVSIT